MWSRGNPPLVKPGLRTAAEKSTKKALDRVGLSSATESAGH